MLTVEEALDKILSSISLLDIEEKPIIDSLGQVIAADIYAPFSVPSKDNSAMDGYAVRAEDIKGANREHPKILKITGEIPAGQVPQRAVESGTAIRIMTGATIPQGADVVVPFENTDEVKPGNSSKEKAQVGVLFELEKGENIRHSGEDMLEGELIMKKGKLLTPADIGVLASMGKTKVTVFQKPVVGILATGNEVTDLDKPLVPGKLYNSNSYSLAAQVLFYGGIPKLLGIAPDDVQQLVDALRRGFKCDMLVTSGGVSVGDYDVVKEVLSMEGDISFWSVRMKPGKPLAFGMFRRGDGTKIAHMGLPGNPVSSMVTFEVFIRPALYKMLGRTDWERPVLKAVLENSVKNKDGRRIFLRVILSKRDGRYYARLTGEQGSGILTSMVKANALAIVPETVPELKEGSMIDVIMLGWSSIPC